MTSPDKSSISRVRAAVYQFNARGGDIAGRGAPFQRGRGHGRNTVYRRANMDGNRGNGSGGIHPSCWWIMKP